MNESVLGCTETQLCDRARGLPNSTYSLYHEQPQWVQILVINRSRSGVLANPSGRNLETKNSLHHSTTWSLPIQSSSLRAVDCKSSLIEGDESHLYRYGTTGLRIPG